MDHSHAESAAGEVEVRPFFLDAGHGPLFAAHHRPGGGRPLNGSVLFVPPFNEEMNRCRSMVTLQARAFARHGVGTLVVDPHGTGDSAGEYGDARWSVWLDGLRLAVEWLHAQPGGCCAVWGIRLGALLAAQVRGAIDGSDCKLVLWQPVVEGKTHFTQFLRVKIAGQMDRPDLPKETTAGLRAQLAAGGPVEIGGYEIHPELAAAIDAARMVDVNLPAGTNVLWLERAATPESGHAPASSAVITAWQDRGLAVNAELFEGQEFWQLHERSEAPAVIEATTRWLCSRSQDK